MLAAGGQLPPESIPVLVLGCFRPHAAACSLPWEGQSRSDRETPPQSLISRLSLAETSRATRARSGSFVLLSSQSCAASLQLKWPAW